MLLSVSVFLHAADFPSSTDTSIEPVSAEQFSKIQRYINNLKFPVKREVITKALAGETKMKWVLDITSGVATDVHSYGYFAIEPYVPAAGGFCIELEYLRRDQKLTGEVAGARICFLSRFGTIFYEKSGK